MPSQRHPVHPTDSKIPVPQAVTAQPSPAMAHAQLPPRAHNHHLQSRADGARAHPCYWDVLHTQFHLSPKRSVGDTVRSLHTPAQQRAVCWRDGCLNIEELSNKCEVHRAGKPFNNFSMLISQSKYSQCDVPTAKGVFFCLDQARVFCSTAALTFFPDCEEEKVIMHQTGAHSPAVPEDRSCPPSEEHTLIC